MPRSAYLQPDEDAALMSSIPDRIRVVHIITKLELGGAQLNTLYTAEHLPKDRFDVYLICGTGGMLDKRAAALKDVKTIFVPDLRNDINPLYSLRAFRRITSLLKEIQPHIVHTHSSKAGVVGRWAAWRAGVPVILHTIHGFAFSPFLPWWRNTLYVFMERITSTITTRFISVSRANISEGVAAGILDQKDAALIRSGVDIKRFSQVKVDRAAKLRSLGVADSGARVVTMLACLKPQKAPLDFVRVASRIHAVEPGVHFLLAGDGELRHQVERKVREMGLSSVFHLLGWREDVDEILAVTDVFMLTSLWEGLPQVFPQALAAGVPVVGTDVDGADEVIHHGNNGFLAHPRAITKLADAALLLLQNEALRREMVLAARERLDEFDQDKMVEDQEVLYIEQLIMASRKSP